MANRSLNKIILMGNLTRDPELKYTPQGTAVCTFGIATNRAWTTASGEIKEDVQFHRIVAWQKLAELSAQLLKKGRKVYLEGRIAYRNYTAKDGAEKSITEIVMSDFILCDGKMTGAAEGASTTHDSDVAIQSVDEPDLHDHADVPLDDLETVDLDDKKDDDIPF